MTSYYDLRASTPYKPSDFTHNNVRAGRYPPTFAVSRALNTFLEELDNSSALGNAHRIRKVIATVKHRIACLRHEDKVLVDELEFLLCFDRDSIPDRAEIHRRIKALGVFVIPEGRPIQEGEHFSTTAQAQAYREQAASSTPLVLTRAATRLFDVLVRLQSMHHEYLPDLRPYLPPANAANTFDLHKTLGAEWHEQHGLEAMFAPAYWQGHAHADKRITGANGRTYTGADVSLNIPDINVIQALWVLKPYAVGTRDVAAIGRDKRVVAADMQRERDRLEYNYCTILAKMRNESEGKAIYRGRMLMGAYIHIIRKAYSILSEMGDAKPLPDTYEIDDFLLPEYPSLPTAEPEGFYKGRAGYWHYVKCAIANPETQPNYLTPELSSYAANEDSSSTPRSGAAQRQKAYRARVKAKRSRQLAESPSQDGYVCPFTGKIVRG